jgi:hypothetical protein
MGFLACSPIPRGGAKTRPVPVLLMPFVVDPSTIAQSRAGRREGSDDTLFNQPDATRRYAYLLGAQSIPPTLSSQCRNPPLAARHTPSARPATPGLGGELPARCDAAGWFADLAFGACSALGDFAHDDAARERHGIATDRKAVAVEVGPSCADLSPSGPTALAVDSVDAVRRLCAGNVGLRFHDLLLSFCCRTIQRLDGEQQGQAIEPRIKPTNGPKGAELHKPKARKRAGLNLGGPAPNADLNKDAGRCVGEQELMLLHR